MNRTLVRLGRRLHPVEITEAWYAQDCPPALDTSGLGRLVWLRWRVACILRGARS